MVVGDRGVVENGGAVDKMGTYKMEKFARDLGKPFYIAAGSYKFVRLFLLNQLDLTNMVPEDGMSFVDMTIWGVMGVVMGTRPLLRHWIILCVLQGGRIGGDQSNDTMTI